MSCQDIVACLFDSYFTDLKTNGFITQKILSFLEVQLNYKYCNRLIFKYSYLYFHFLLKCQFSKTNTDSLDLIFRCLLQTIFHLKCFILYEIFKVYYSVDFTS